MGSESASEPVLCEVSAGCPSGRASAKSLWSCYLLIVNTLAISGGASRGAAANAILRPILVQPELRPQINSPDLIVGRQRVGRSALEDHAIVHDIRPVGDPQCFAHVAVGVEDADTPLLEVKEDILVIG